MKRVETVLVSHTPYSQSRQHTTEKLDKETAPDYELRTWREKCTVDDYGQIVIPAMALKQALDSVAKRLGRQIPGKGKATYTKHFLAGVSCEDNVALTTDNKPIMKETVESISINANVDGVRGSGKRITRIFPLIPQWLATARFLILDDTVTKAIFEEHLHEAGQFVGIGRFRPEKGGLNGRFTVKSFTWEEI